MTEPTVLPLAELPLGESRVLKHHGRSVAVFHTEEGIFAIDNDCPHAYAPLAQGGVKDCVVTCFLHLWSFDIRTGAPVQAPSGARIRTYLVEVAGGEIRILGDKD